MPSSDDKNVAWFGPDRHVSYKWASWHHPRSLIWRLGPLTSTTQKIWSFVHKSQNVFFFQHNYEAECFFFEFFGGQISNAAMSILFTHFIILATYLSRHVSASFGVNLGLHYMCSEFSYLFMTSNFHLHLSLLFVSGFGWSRLPGYWNMSHLFYFVGVACFCK